MTKFIQGDIINGSYLVLDKIAEGGMGTIYKVEHQALKKTLALKTVTTCADEKMQQIGWQRFQREAQTISRLTHRSIIQVYDFGMTADAVGFYVMEYIEGKTLAEVVRENGQLPAARSVSIFMQVAQGLAYAHSQGIVHRDIKPSNIMLSGETISQGECLVKIVDFGLAQFIEKSQMPRSSNPLEQAELLMGSPPYMSPEQFQNTKIDHRSDIYSYGCALFESLTGVPPFISDSPLVLSMMHCSELPPTLSQASLGCRFPAQLEQIQSLLLAKNPEERYQDMEAVAKDLAVALKHLEAMAKDLEARFKPGDRPREGIEQPSGRQQIAFSNKARLDNPYVKVADSFGQSESVTISPRPEAKATKAILLLGPLLIMVVLIGLAVLTGLPQKLFRPATSNVSRDAVITQVEKKEVPNDGSSKNQFIEPSKKPFSTIVNDAAGKKVRLFRFPENISLGRITNREIEHDSGVLAKGVVIIPFEQQNKFTPSIICCNSPSYFRRFRADDLYALSVNNNESMTSETLNYIDHLSGLQDLSVLQTGINDDAIAALDELVGLRKLDVSNSDITGPALAKMKILNQLISLRADQIVDIGQVLENLQRSPNLKILHINGCHLRNEDLETITKIPKLQELAISTTGITLVDLRVLARCPALDRLVTIGNGFKDDIIPVLKQFKHLKMLRINCDGWSKREIAALNISFPDMEIQIQERY